MAWYTISFRGQDVGIQPSFLLFQRLVDGQAPATAAPAIHEVGYGLYKFAYEPIEEVVFVIDANANGASVPDTDRYVRGVIGPMDGYLDAAVSTRAAPEDVAPYATFLGGGETDKPVIFSVMAPSRSRVQVTFSEPVKMTTDLDGALTLTNYVSDLTLLEVSQLSDRAVELTTELQVPGQTYTLTIQNIVDLNGNAI